MTTRTYDLARACLLACAMACLGGCGGKYAQQLRALESADPEAEAEAAVAQGDYRFIRVLQDTEVYPGVPDSSLPLVRRHGARTIENTSDAIENSEHRELQVVAFRYGDRYNKRLLARLPSQ